MNPRIPAAIAGVFAFSAFVYFMLAFTLWDWPPALADWEPSFRCLFAVCALSVGIGCAATVPNPKAGK